jgi:hypothetical protein
MFGYAVLFAIPTMKREQTTNWDRASAEGTTAAASPAESNATANHLDMFDLPHLLTLVSTVGNEIVGASE